MFCSQCGSYETGNYCEKCGTKLERQKVIKDGISDEEKELIAEKMKKKKRIYFILSVVTVIIFFVFILILCM